LHCEDSGLGLIAFDLFGENADLIEVEV
jgi:hypothetical protein